MLLLSPVSQMKCTEEAGFGELGLEKVILSLSPSHSLSLPLADFSLVSCLCSDPNSPAKLTASCLSSWHLQHHIFVMIAHYCPYAHLDRAPDQ